MHPNPGKERRGHTCTWRKYRCGGGSAVRGDGVRVFSSLCGLKLVPANSVLASCPCCRDGSPKGRFADASRWAEIHFTRRKREREQ
jgi:hypothetical protein